MSSDAALARMLAAEAGRRLMALRAAGQHEGRSLGDAGDALANRYLVDALRAARPGDAILSEEEAADPARLQARRVWIVDPLDGTREYSEGRDDWAVHVALSIDGAPAAGAVALPALDECYCSEFPKPLPAEAAPLRLLVSRTRPSPLADAVARALGAVLVPMGSGGAKAMAVLRGEGDIYLHSGGMYEWDNCAPVAVALAAGLHASRLDGTPIPYNRADPLSPEVLICHRARAPALLALLQGLPRG